MSACNRPSAAGCLTVALALLLAWATPATAQPVSNPSSYTRTSSFSYQANGLLQSETVEPDLPNQCVTTTYTYDAWGNKTGATTANCAGASGLALFDSRSSGSTYAAQAVAPGVLFAPAGTFATTSTNALSQSETRTYDPRFGTVVALTGPNSLTTTWQLDDFGRKMLELRADGTRTAVYHCWIKVYEAASAQMVAATIANAAYNSTGCHNGSVPVIAAPVLNEASEPKEAPADAVRYEHTEPRNATAKIGAFTRVYFDRAGRKLRTVTEAFDGAAQPGGTARLIVQDTEYDPRGNPLVSTQPYFLDSNSSTATGSNDYGMTMTVVDALGRPKEVYTTDGQGHVASQAFGTRGSRRAAKTTLTYVGLTTTTVDDKNNQRIEEKNPDGKLVRVTDALNATLVHQHDAFGNLIGTKDALQNTISLVYDTRGRKLTQRDPDAGVIAYCYDALGQLKSQQTSNQRGSHNAVDGACPATAGTGSTAPPISGWTTLAYDKLGRTTSRAEPEFSTTWTFDKYTDGSACAKGIGKLCQVFTTHGVNRKFSYDSLGRPSSARLDVTGGPTAATAVGYDSNGRVASQTYPTGVQVTYAYTAKGYLASQSLTTAVNIWPRPANAGGTPVASQTWAGGLLWRADAVNAWGKTESSYLRNGINQRAVFDGASGRVTNLTAGAGAATNVVDQRLTWDSLNRLTMRVDALGDGNSGVQISDTFQYDALGRLTQYQVAGNGTPTVRTVALQYNALGMLLYKTDVGVYTYPAQAGGVGSRPHAVQQVAGEPNASYGYDLNGNMVSASGGKYRTVGYTSFNLPDNNTATGGIGGPGGSPRYTWQYDDEHKRIKEIRSNAQGTRTTWYLHPDNQGGLGFEREEFAGSASNRHYLTAGGTVIGVLVTTGALPSLPVGSTAPPLTLGPISAVKVEFWHKDHLGSLVATTDHLGNVTARYAYDPFGKRRHTNATYDAFGTLVIDWTTDTNRGTDRGFTGHEHLDDVGLVHMNGRIFDPTIGRFMQPDPFIQEPGNLLNFDRYGYCFNSPMACTDPTGYFSLSRFFKKWLRPILAIAVNFVLPGAGGLLAGTFGGTLIATNVVVNAAVSGFVSGAIATGSLKGALQGAFTAGVFAGVGNVIAGVDAVGGTFEGVKSVANGAGITSPFGQVAMHGVAGCVTSIAGGGKCGPGALSAGFSKLGLVGGFIPKDGLGGAFASAIVGGTASVLGGGKFANGAVTAAAGYLFNWLVHAGVKLKVPLIGGASFGIGVSNTNGTWDAGVIIDSDLPVVSAGKLMGKAAVEVGLQEGDFVSNKGEQTLNISAGAKGGGLSIQKGSDGRITGGAVSFGPQLGYEVGGQQTRTLSVRNEIVPAVRSAVDKIKHWFGP